MSGADAMRSAAAPSLRARSASSAATTARRRCQRTGVAFHRAALFVPRVCVCRKRLKLAGLRTEVSEDRFGLLGHLPNHLHDPLAEADATQFGEGLLGLVVARHVLSALAAQRANKFGLIGKIIAAIVERQPVAVSRHGNIG